MAWPGFFYLWWLMLRCHQRQYMLHCSTLDLWILSPAGSTLPLDPKGRANWHMPGSAPAPKQQRRAPKKQGKAKQRAAPAKAEEPKQQQQQQQQQEGSEAAVRR
jgi:hypothetical protein